MAKVPNDYLVSDGRNKYSVPYNLIGGKVDIRVTKTIVDVYFHGSLVASHRRLQTKQREPLMKLEHMPQEHQQYLAYNAEDFKTWAMSVGPMTEKAVQHFLDSRKAPEQGYKACASLKSSVTVTAGNVLKTPADGFLRLQLRPLFAISAVF